MMKKKEESKNLLESLAATIKKLSDPNYQYQVWVKQNNLSNDQDFDGVVCFFFELCQEIEKSGATHFNILENQYTCLITFRNLLDAYYDHAFADSVDDWEIWTDPRWQRVQRAAGNLLLLFKLYS